MPPQFDPRNQQRTGIEVLGQGLPDLPGILTHQMSIPVAFWTAGSCGVVLFLQFSRGDDGTFSSHVMMGTYFRDGGRWAAHEYWAGTGWSHDPVADPEGLRDLGGQPIAGGSGLTNPNPRPGFPAAVITGRATPAVTSIVLVHDDRADRRNLRSHSHFGAWVVCTERWSPYQIDALDDTGTVIGSITGPDTHPADAF